MMVVEIATGWIFRSMALLADGWHMSSHVLALGLTAGAYALSRRYANDTRFAFGTWKIEVLGGFTSAILLGGVALFMALESIERLFHPVAILFDQMAKAQSVVYNLIPGIPLLSDDQIRTGNEEVFKQLGIKMSDQEIRAQNEEAFRRLGISPRQ
jgi:cation diffusion facilitator family transporter